MSLSEVMAATKAAREKERRSPANIRDNLEVALMHLSEAGDFLRKVEEGLRGTDAFTAIYAEGGAQQLRLLARKLEEHAKLDVQAGLIAPELETGPRECSACDGTGGVRPVPCNKCDGTGSEVST